MSANDQWSDEEISRLKELWGKGVSCEKIGEAIGRNKNAVIGKAHRLRLPMRRPSYGQMLVRAGISPKERRDGPTRARQSRKARNGPKLVFVAPQAELPLPPTCKPIRFADIEADQCRYVIGETDGPDTKMCGAPIEAHSLCAWHRKLCWHPMPKKAAKQSGLFVLPKVGVAA